MQEIWKLLNHSESNFLRIFVVLALCLWFMIARHQYLRDLHGKKSFEKIEAKILNVYLLIFYPIVSILVIKYYGYEITDSIMFFSLMYWMLYPMYFLARHLIYPLFSKSIYIEYQMEKK